MSKSYGGKQKSLWVTLIKKECRYLGKFSEHTLKPSDMQYMVFQTGDEGPFWMSKQKREDTRKDVLVDNQTVKRKFKMEELTEKLKEQGVITTENINKIKKLCIECGIALESNEEPKIQPGWEQKPTGMLLVLWEHRFINSTNLKQYTIDGTKDVYGVIQVETSLKYLLSNCKDFKEEESLLQAMG